MEMKEEEYNNKKGRNRTMYITYVDEGICRPLYITRPRITEKKSLESAENMVANALMKARGFIIPDPFREGLERDFPEILEECSDHIGITVPVAVPIDMKPRDFRARFCSDRIFRSASLMQNQSILWT